MRVSTETEESQGNYHLLPILIPESHSRGKCDPCSTSPAVGIRTTVKGILVDAMTPVWFMLCCESLRPGAAHSANSHGLGNLGCASGFDYVWTSSFTIDNCHSLEIFLPSCALGKKRKKKRKINKLFLWFVLVAAGISDVLNRDAQATIGKRTDQLSGTRWPFRPPEPSQKPCQLQTSCGIRNCFWRHCQKVLIR